MSYERNLATEEMGTLPEISVPEAFGMYRTEKTISKNLYSVIVRALDLKKNQMCACKVVSRKLLAENCLLKHFEREVRTIQCLSHPNIVSVYDIQYRPDSVIIVMEYCENGDLFDYILKKHKVSTNQIIRIMKDLLSALAYMHSKGIAHRDIKPENIVFDQEMNPKFIDFGVCSATQDALCSSFVGTSNFIPPELYLNEQYDPKAADIWSFAMTMYMLATGTHPLNGVNEPKKISMFKDGVIEGLVHLDDRIDSIIKQMLSVDPLKRPTALDALSALPELSDHSLIPRCFCTGVYKLPRERKVLKFNQSQAWNRRKSLITTPIIRNFHIPVPL